MTTISDQGTAKHQPALDWLRFGAAMMVCLSHYRSFHWKAFGDLEVSSQTIGTKMFFMATRWGHESVLIFFVLSGYFVGGRLLTKSLLGEFDGRKYAIDRVSRILLPLIPALVLTGIVGVAIKKESWDWPGFFGNAFSMQGVFVPPFMGNSPLWSLSYEVWFYVAAGCVGMIIVGRKSHHFFVGAVLSLSFFTVLDARYLLIWAIGALAYCLGPRWRSKWLLSFGLLVVIASGAVLQLSRDSSTWESLVAALGSFELDQFGRYQIRSLAEMLFGGGVALLLSWIANSKKSDVKSSLHGPIDVLGKLGVFLASFSFSLYLIHIPFYHVITTIEAERIGEVSTPSVLHFLLKVGGVMVAAYGFASITEFRTATFRRKFDRWLP